MHDNKDYEPFPDMRDPVTGDWLPMSESDMKRKDAADLQQKLKQSDNSAIAGMLSSILK